MFHHKICLRLLVKILSSSFMYLLLWMVGVIICFSLLLITSCLVLLKYFTMFQLTLIKRLRCCGIRDKKHWEISNLFFLDCVVNGGFKIKLGSWFFSRMTLLTMTFSRQCDSDIIYTLPAYLTHNSTWKSAEETGACWLFITQDIS